MFTQFTCNGSFISHTSYVLVVQKNCLIETTLLRTKNICCGLVNGGLNDVYSIYLEVLYTSYVSGAQKNGLSEMVLFKYQLYYN